MSEPNVNVYDSSRSQDGLRAYINKVFLNIGLAVVVTALVAWWGYTSLINGGVMYQVIVRYTSLTYWVSLIAEFAIVIAMSTGLWKMKASTTRILMVLYAVVTGLTFSFLPLVFDIATIFQAFVFAAALFISCAVIGRYTRVDMSKFSGLLIGGLFALIIMSIISMFVPALRDGLLIGYIGLILFLAITAWDMQTIKNYYYQYDGTELGANLAIYGAFQLYLDFLNIFLYVLRILGSGNSKD